MAARRNTRPSTWHRKRGSKIKSWGGWAKPPTVDVDVFEYALSKKAWKEADVVNHATGETTMKERVPQTCVGDEAHSSISRIVRASENHETISLSSEPTSLDQRPSPLRDSGENHTWQTSSTRRGPWRGQRKRSWEERRGSP